MPVAVDNVELTILRQEIAELRADVRALTDAWNAARGIVRAARWLATVAGAAATIWAIFHVGHTVK